MSKSFKGEARAQARAVQQRREARHSKIESRHSTLESKDQAKTMPTYPLDASPARERAWTPLWQR